MSKSTKKSNIRYAWPIESIDRKFAKYGGDNVPYMYGYTQRGNGAAVSARAFCGIKFERRSTVASAAEIEARAALGFVAKATKARREDLTAITDDQQAFNRYRKVSSFGYHSYNSWLMAMGFVFYDSATHKVNWPQTWPETMPVKA